MPALPRAAQAVVAEEGGACSLPEVGGRARETERERDRERDREVKVTAGFGEAPLPRRAFPPCMNITPLCIPPKVRNNYLAEM